MNILHEHNDKKGRFYIKENEKEVATLTYTFAGDAKFIIDHTEVDASQGGKGLGKQLVLAVIDFARQNNYKIMPLCPYAKSVFDKSEDYNDVLF